MKLFLFSVSMLILSQMSSVAMAAVQLKDGPGKNRVVSNCMTCHSLDYISMNSGFLDRKGWEAVVNKMIKVMGAPIKTEEVPEIVDYLTKNYGKS